FVLKIDRMLHAALPAKLEPDGRALDLRVLVAHGRQADGTVLLRVLLVADANEGFFEQLDHRGKHLFTGEAPPFQVGVGPPADSGQGAGESDELAVFHFVADVTPARVIPILFAAARVAAGRL